MPKKNRYILLPFSLIYGGIIYTRNELFDRNIFRSASFDFPLICVGNLSVGGTGKTPMVEYLVNLLHNKYKTATLSRGYKRRTKGFLIADENSNVFDIGDEPMQIHSRFPEITVAVAEERVIGIPQLLATKPGTEVIVLDDAFQHREVSAGLNILLTDYNNPYSGDFLLPVGSLRDIKKSRKRADIIVVTKCKSNLNIGQRDSLIHELRLVNSQKIFFTTIEYQQPYHLFSKEKYNWEKRSEVLIVCGIANPNAIADEVVSKVAAVKMMKFKDHYSYDPADIKKIVDRFSKMVATNKIIVTTEKDATRLLQFENELKDIPVYVLPMTHRFLFEQGKEFEKIISEFVENNRKDNEFGPG